MKNIFMIAVFSSVLFSCGKNNKVNTNTVSGSNTYEASLVSLEGNYDLVDSNHLDCSANIQITNGCDGIKIESNRGTREEFCNINKGEINSRINSFSGNTLRSEIVFHRAPNTPVSNNLPTERAITFVDTLTFKANGVMVRNTSHKTKASGECMYQKR